MTVSTLAYIKEKVRQAVTDDYKFLERHLHFFELQYKLLSGNVHNLMFPLILPPENYTMEEPFTVEVTPTQRGGLYVEENGIVQRMIKIRGTTGFKPRQLKTVGFMPGEIHSPQLKNKSYTRDLSVVPLMLAQKLSGQRHIQYLQDKIFRAYGDLKKDPATSEGTVLIYHNPKDDEHWIVVPQKFTIDRDKGSPTTYKYSIDLLAVERGDAVDKDFSEDKSFLDRLKDAQSTIKKGIDMATGALNDLTALNAEAKRTVGNFAEIIDSVTSILSAADDFVAGITDWINVPSNFINSTIDLVETAGALSESLRRDYGAEFHDKVSQDMRRLVDAMENFGTHPELFREPDYLYMDAIKGWEDSSNISTIRRDEALASSAPTTIAALNGLGTELTPGEAEALYSKSDAGGETLSYKSASSVSVDSGDTLASLAAKYLGDARLWKYIAIANGLKPPFVDMQASKPLVDNDADESPFGESFGIGDKILIPSNDTSTLGYPVLPVLGTAADEPFLNHLLGVDAVLEPVEGGITGDSRKIYDIPPDVEKGNTDVKLAEGLDNLKQMILSRIITDQGTDTLYKRLGVKRIVGLNFVLSDIENGKLRLQEAVIVDPRIAAIQNMRFDQVSDKFTVEMDAIVNGLGEKAAIETTI